jgi:hypothetical protein
MVKSLFSFFKEANFSFFTSGYDYASDLLLDMKDLSWFIELLFFISESFCELRELLTLTSPCSLAFFYSSCWASSSFKYSSVYSLYFLVISLYRTKFTLSVFLLFRPPLPDSHPSMIEMSWFRS